VWANGPFFGGDIAHCGSIKTSLRKEFASGCQRRPYTRFCWPGGRRGRVATQTFAIQDHDPARFSFAGQPGQSASLPMLGQGRTETIMHAPG
jgi:hypothetical protein